MNTNVWAKTTLTAYPYLNNIADAIDRMVERRAMNSFYVSSTNYASSNIYDIANHLIDLSERKVVLINLKILVETCLKKCSKVYAKLLIARYLSKKKSGEICAIFNMPQRTYFRKIGEAEKQFELIMRNMGFDDSRLTQYLKEEEWILDIKSQFEKTEDVQVSRRTLRHAVS